jgi:hypothetical protein
MHRSHTNDRGRRDNGRRGSSHENDNSNRNQYEDSWRPDNHRYEDDRYRSISYGRRKEDDYGPFSNIYSNGQTGRGREFDTHYNDKSNYYHGNSPVNDRSDEARGMSFGDLFNSRKRNQRSDYNYNENRYGRNDGDRDKSYSGYSTNYDKRRRTEGY